MAILFAGGELEDFVTVGAVAFTAGGSSSRSTYARGSIDPTGSAFNVNYATANFAASSSFSVTTRWYNGISFGVGAAFLWLSAGGSPRLRLKVNSASPSTLTLESYTSGGTATALATSALTVLVGTLYRLDLIVNYGTSGRVRLYVDQVLYLDTGTMDVTASGALTLDSVSLGPARASSTASSYSEVIVADEDTRPLTLKTLAPNGVGDTSAWTGAFGDVDETVGSDVDVISSATAGQVMNMECTGMPSGASGLSVRAVKVVASALRGASGPQKLQLGVKSGSTEGWSADKTLDTGYTAVSNTWTVNPATGAAFTSAEIDALKLAVKSVA